MTSEEFTRNYPRAYHMAESGTWESIRAHGLLSTIALLDLFGINGSQRQQIVARRRPLSVPLTHRRYGEVVIRDQKPMSDSALQKCLDPRITPTDWYQILNGRVFFWVCERRLNRLLAARAYRGKQHCVLTLDMAKLLKRYAGDATLCPINSGSTIFKPQPRGTNSFLPIAQYPFEEWKARRGSRDAVVELTIKYAVHNVEDFVLSVEERRGTKVIARMLG